MCVLQETLFYLENLKRYLDRIFQLNFPNLEKFSNQEKYEIVLRIAYKQVTVPSLVMFRNLSFLETGRQMSVIHCRGKLVELPVFSVEHDTVTFGNWNGRNID